MTIPTVSDVAQELYDRLGPWRDNDPTTPDPLINLVPNGSFERDAAGSTPAGWIADPGYSVAFAGWTTSDPPVGGRALHTTNAATTWWITQEVPQPVTAGVSYTARVSYFQVTSGSNGWDLYIRWLRGNGSEVSAVNTHVGNVGNGSLGVMTVVGVAPVDAVAAYIQIRHSTDTSEMYFDAFKLAPTSQGTTYFDGDDAGWSWSGTPGNSVSSTPDFTYPLLALCEALIGQWQGIEDIIRDDPLTDDPGWSTVMDVNRAPSEWLAWLAQFAGVRLRDGLSDADQRAWIKSTDGFRRGSPTAMVGAVQAYLTGTKTVYLTERHGSAYRLTVATKLSETPNTAQVAAAALLQKPAGIVMAVTVVNGSDYQTLRDTHDSYTDVKNTFVNYTEVISNPSKQ